MSPLLPHGRIPAVRPDVSDPHGLNMIDLSTGAPKRHVLERFPGLDAPDDAAPGEARSAPPGPGFVDARRSFEWKQIPLVLVVEAAGGSLWAAQSGRGRA